MAASLKLDVDIVFRTPRYQSPNVDSKIGGLLPTDGQPHKVLTKDRKAKASFPMKPCFDVVVQFEKKQT